MKNIWSEYNMVAIGCFALLVAIFVGIHDQRIRRAEILSEQFAAQVVKTNDLSAVATQLRQSERGYLAEMKNGRLLRICSGGEKIQFCDFNLGDNYSNDPMVLAKLVKRVVKPTDSDWGDVAFTFTRGERTK